MSCRGLPRLTGCLHNRLQQFASIRRRLPQSPPPITEGFVVYNQPARTQFLDASTHLWWRQSQLSGQRRLINTWPSDSIQAPKYLQLRFA
jgi:hypothetical protein